MSKPELAITLPLDVVDRLSAIAHDNPKHLERDDLDVLELVEREIAAVRAAAGR